jgi:hypothetical protein
MYILQNTETGTATLIRILLQLSKLKVIVYRLIAEKEV